MSFHSGAAVWIDHQEARIYEVAEGVTRETKVQAPHRHLHRHSKAADTEHPDDAHHFYAEVAHALEGAKKILVVGPATAKLEFIRYAREHASGVAGYIVGVEASDRLTDAELVANIKRYFHVPTRVH